MEFNRSEKRTPATGLRSHLEAEAAARARGRLSEESVFSICTVLFLERELRFLTDLPRMATIKQDRSGIDIVCPSDVGELYLQVKSSALRAQRFRETRKKRGFKAEIGIVVAHHDDPLVTAERVVSTLHRTRAAVRRAQAVARGRH